MSQSPNIKKEQQSIFLIIWTIIKMCFSFWKRKKEETLKEIEVKKQEFNKISEKLKIEYNKQEQIEEKDTESLTNIKNIN